MQAILLVGLGGAVGAVARYLSVSLAARLFGAAFPYGTLFVNVAGSLAMGLAAAMILERVGAGRGVWFAMSGVLGGFTTFSAFSLDAIQLIERGKVGAATVYIAASVILSIGALIVGLYAGRSLL
ncbi:MAG: fluoride efflux transporter CrcB [Pseudomonadota bacterium]